MWPFTSDTQKSGGKKHRDRKKEKDKKKEQNIEPTADVAVERSKQTNVTVTEGTLQRPPPVTVKRQPRPDNIRTSDVVEIWDNKKERK